MIFMVFVVVLDRQIRYYARLNLRVQRNENKSLYADETCVEGEVWVRPIAQPVVDLYRFREYKR